MYTKIFQQYVVNGFGYDAKHLEFVYRFYDADKRPLRACEPRDLMLRCADHCKYENLPKTLSNEIILLAWKNYFGAAPTLEYRTGFPNCADGTSRRSANSRTRRLHREKHEPHESKNQTIFIFSRRWFWPNWEAAPMPRRLPSSAATAVYRSAIGVGHNPKIFDGHFSGWRVAAAASSVSLVRSDAAASSKRQPCRWPTVGSLLGAFHRDDAEPKMFAAQRVFARHHAAIVVPHRLPCPAQT